MGLIVVERQPKQSLLEGLISLKLVCYVVCFLAFVFYKCRFVALFLDVFRLIDFQCYLSM